MSDTLSLRAQSILAAIEREAAAAPTRARPAAPPDPPTRRDVDLRSGRRDAPRPDRDVNRDGSIEIEELVSSVVAQADQARLRLAALSEAIEDIAGRLRVPRET